MGRIVVKTLDEALVEARFDQAKIDATTEEDIIQHMIEDGEDPHDNLGDFYPSPLKVRQALGLTQVEMAELLGMPVATWRNWEQARTAIDAPGRALLRILQNEPEAAVRAMGKKAA